MISKLFAWIMAVLAALFSGNSLHTQEPQVYQGVPGYEINADSIDYYDLYNKSAGNSDKESDDLDSELDLLRNKGFEIIDVKPYLDTSVDEEFNEPNRGYNFLILYKDKSDGL